MLIAVVLVGCKSSKRLTATKVPEVTASEAAIPSYLASRLQLTIPGKGGSMSVGGTMKMKSRERVQISLLMPILRTELARIEVTPTEVLFVDRMNKRFVRATKKELKEILSKNVEFSQLEKLLTDASKPGGKTELSGKTWESPKLEKAKVQLYDFSTKELSITPTEVTSRYRQVLFGRINENAGSFIMIKRLFVILVSSLWLAIPLSAQSNKLIRELEGKRGALQKQIAETESILQNTKEGRRQSVERTGGTDGTD